MYFFLGFIGYKILILRVFITESTPTVSYFLIHKMDEFESAISLNAFLLILYIYPLHILDKVNCQHMLSLEISLEIHLYIGIYI